MPGVLPGAGGRGGVGPTRPGGYVGAGGQVRDPGSISSEDADT